MVSEQAIGNQDPGYDEGLYCKWKVRGEEGKPLILTFLNADIPPLSDHCDYDGIIVEDGDQLIGPLCGSNHYNTITTKSNEVTIVFYSDTAFQKRKHGVLRMLVENTESCPIKEMEVVKSLKYTSDCGTVLSPNFPGMVPPGLWTWTIQGLKQDEYFVIYLQFVKGPAVKGDCDQTFKLKEIPHDSSKLKQFEVSILTLCGSTDLFIPKKRLKLPPYQKLGIELDTRSKSIPYRWEFKLSYIREKMSAPELTSDIYECTEEYTYYRGSCYKYFPWVYRHYQEKYNWQQTWQNSLSHCEDVENGTLISIQDEDEAYFVKYMLANDWNWNKAAAFHSNSRLIFIGLHNKYGTYQWTDGSQLGFADWYIPPEAWEQPTLLYDAIGTDFLELRNAQPVGDVGSLCTAMLVKSPFASLSWAKVPCDLPIFRSGLICEKPATRIDNQTTTAGRPPVDSVITNGTVTVCPDGWFMINNSCLQMLSNFKAANNPEIATPWSREEASRLCQDIGGVLAAVDVNLLQKLIKYLYLWRHDVRTGHIWVNGSETGFDVIKAKKTQFLDEDTNFELDVFVDNGDLESYPRNVLCQTRSIVREERCRDQEFQCGDLSCVNIDSVCDGKRDCADFYDEQNCECHDGMFRCRDGQCISISLYCDFRKDCDDGSDEEFCVINPCNTNEFACKSGQCIPKDKTCDFKADCIDGSDEDSITCERQCKGVQCFSGMCINPQLKNDLITDCPGLIAEDEVHRSTMTFFEIYLGGRNYDNETLVFGCDEEMTHVQCREGKQRCYDRSKICVYDTERVDDNRKLDVLATCRDGAHLRNLCADVECQDMFHCPGSYCLPFRKVCDDVIDCPDGSDEKNCQNYTCPGLFRCKGERFCISHGEVCDGKVDCHRYGEDEKYCFGNRSQGVPSLCTNGCSCKGNIIDCTRTGQSGTLQLSLAASNTKALLLAHNRISLAADSLLFTYSLGRLILRDNRLSRLPDGLFHNLHNLFDLDLSDNYLTTLEPGIFDGLASLRRLNLANNGLFGLQRATLRPLRQLDHLILTGNSLADVTRDVFADVPSLRELNSDAYKFCCIVPQAERCTPPADEFSSCEDLMANRTLQLSIWILGVVAFFGNLFVVIWRTRQKRSGQISSFFIVNLGISDFLMGVYLLIIAAVDTYYRGDYIVYADSWRDSVLCQVAGITAMLSSEASVFMLTAITVDRLMNILFPLKMGNIRMKHARLTAVSGWAVCLGLSILPALKIPYFGDAFFGRTGVCLPFQVTNQKLPGWEYSVFIFLVVNLVSFVVIFISYACIFLKVRESIENMKEKSTSTADEHALAMKLAVIVATDFICWVPIIMIGFAALGGARIPPQVSAWIAVFILPLNSAMNPILYTISALNCRKRKGPTAAARRSRPATSSTALTAVPLANKPVTNAARSVVKNAEGDGLRTARI